MSGSRRSVNRNSVASSERACMLCGLVQPLQVFKTSSCPNCSSIFDSYKPNEPLDLKIYDLISPSFEGMICILKPEKSWCSKWLRFNKYVPGMYAVKINGRLPEEVLEELPHFVPRDGSVQWE